MASTLFINAKVWQPNGSFDEAFGVKENKFNFTGSNSQAENVRSNYDNVVDLKGKLVLPGLIDGHLHLVYGSQMRKRLNASKTHDVDSLQKAISTYETQNPSQKWIIGSNLDINQLLKDISLGNGGNFVDKIYSEKPLFITNYDYHSALANTKALQESGIMNRLNEFSPDEIVLDNNSIPTGLIKEKGMDSLFESMPEPTLDEKVNAVSEFISLLHSYGITTVTDITLIEDLEIYNRLYELGRLNVRINSYIPFEEVENLQKHREFTKNIDPDLYTINGFKAFWDGALGSETALFSENYKGSESCGYKTDIVGSGRIYKLAKAISDGGMQMIIHAIGDKAVSEVLDMYQSLYQQGTRHRIEHAQHMQDEDFERFKKYDVVASVQPIHLKYDAKTVQEKLPESLVNKTHNYKKLIDIGVIVNFGTDFPIVEVNPYENIRLAVTRNTSGGIFTPELSIPLHECIMGYTINNAYSNFNENAIGSVAVGKAADFAVMSDDLFEMNSDDINKAKVFKTYLNGAEVYSA